MAQSSILGGQKAPTQARGRDTDALGPSDSSDSGSDVQGEHTHLAIDPQDAGAVPADLDSDTDSYGTGERGAAFGEDVDEGADIRPDRIDALDDVPGDEPGNEPGDEPDDATDIDDAGLENIALDETDEDADESATR